MDTFHGNFGSSIVSLGNLTTTTTTTTKTSAMTRRFISSSSSSSSSWWSNISNTASKLFVSRQRNNNNNNDSEQIMTTQQQRELQERKDLYITLLACEFYRLYYTNNDNNINQRQELVEQAYATMKDKQLDNYTNIQLRYELQNVLEPRVQDLFKLFDQVEQQYNQMSITEIQNLLQLELQNYTNEEEIQQSEKGASPQAFVEKYQDAIQLLLNHIQQQQQQQQTTTTNNNNDNDTQSFTTNTILETPPPADNGPDAFGYHALYNSTETTIQIRNEQVKNICISILLKKKQQQQQQNFPLLQYSTLALQSTIPHAGRGVFVNGFAPAGSIVAFQPGVVWLPEHLLAQTIEQEIDMNRNNSHYFVTLRADNVLLDARKSPFTVLSNPFALGHVLNHPTITNPPNCLCVLYDYTFCSDKIPNTYIQPPTIGHDSSGSISNSNNSNVNNRDDNDNVDKNVVMHGMIVITTRDVANEELFYNYRLLQPPYPKWYEPITNDPLWKNDNNNNDDDEGGKKNIHDNDP